MKSPVKQLLAIHKDLDACRACPNMIGPVVHGPPVASKILLVGQAPGPHEAKFGRPFAWTAGKTMFRWFQGALGVSEEEFRSKVYMAAVARCFPGKAKGGGDRRPDNFEISQCKGFLERETQVLKPTLVLPVGGMAIEQVLGKKVPLESVVGQQLNGSYHGVDCDIICLPHPSGASTWHRMEPGLTLLPMALKLLSRHPEVRRAFPRE